MIDEPDTSPSFDQLPQLGQVELDRFCAGCGYNLRQQPVRRESFTGLMLCKCPECGAFEPANQATTRPRSWFGQLVLLLWLVWIAALGLALVGAVSATVNLTYEAGELLSETRELEEPIPDPRDTSGNSVRMINFEYALHPLDAEHSVELFAYLGAVFVVSAGLLTLVMLFVPHWSHKGYFLLALGWPIIALIVFYCMRLIDHYTLDYATRGLRLWIYLSPLLITLFAYAGGGTAVCLARPIARLVIRILIPARQRGPFAYLWLVDGKTPPRISPEAA